MAYDSTATKERILAAASTEFAEYGVAGARVDRIAANAQANKRAIYDYFGDKKALFAAVLENLMTELAEAVSPSDGDLGTYAGLLFDYHRAHPEAMRLLLWEALEMGDNPVPDEEARTHHYANKIEAAKATFSPDHPDPNSLMFFTLGLVGWSLAMPQVRRMMLGPNSDLDTLRPAICAAARHLAAQPGDTSGA
ncbi:MAG: putative transcriptional regulator, TetR family [Nocardia sp.]|uniref:TetR family transcriptional regulator n=1 Tax=Nocardia sp. TaxID=1821 RepID=UPI00260BA2D1|nr:TetR family transcriptional regulator [Nocardia sp.]MCU1644315.1 putative transcriptional regulator, TetR family [Nocardia sp.]